MSLHDSKFLVEALIRWADTHLQPVFVHHKGERQRGVILLRQELTVNRVRFWVQETNELGQRTFRKRFREDQSTLDADCFVQREIGRDEDLWVLVLENSDGALPPVLIPATS